MVILEPTSIPALCAEIRIKELKDDCIRVVATAYRAEDETRIDEIGTVAGRKTSRKRKQHAINAAIQELEDRYVQVYGIQPLDKRGFLAAFDALEEAVTEQGLRLRSSWKSPQTNSKILTYTEKNIFPLIYPYLGPNSQLFLETDRQEIEDKLIQDYMQKNGGTKERARAKIRDRLDQADCVLANMRDFDHRIPLLHLCPQTPRDRVPSPEQAKDLPRKLLMLFYRRLRELVDSLPYFVFFAVMVIFGLRPAEAAARKPNEIVWHDTYCTLEVTSQERNGKCDKKLKNEYSRRIIIISYWGMCLLRMCCDRIGDDYPRDDVAMNSAVENAQRVKEMLIECGLESETMQQLSDEITEDDLDDDTPKGEDPNKMKQIKIACYILRRIFASILRNEMGMSMYITDRLLGHVSKGIGRNSMSKYQRPDLNSPDTQRAVAEAMERYIFDKRYSLNPACRPYKLSECDNISMIAFSEYVIENDTDTAQVRLLNLEAAEPGDRIEVLLEDGMVHHLTAISTPKSWENVNRTVIGDTTFPKEE